MSLRIPFLSMNKIRKLTWISNEKHRSVVSYEIPVSFFSIELNGKTSWISLRISRARLSSNSRKSSKYRGLLSYGIEKPCFAISRYIFGNCKDSMSTRSFSMNNSLRNSFSIKACNFINKMNIL